MKIETLDYLLVSSRSRTISEAAEKLFLSQTTLSTAIRSVEVELGITIFNRTRSGIELTEPGKRFLKLAEEISELHKEMLTLSQTREETAPIRMIANSMFCNHYSIPIAGRFALCCPNTPLLINEARRDQIQGLLLSESYDFGIGCYYANAEEEFFRQLELAKLYCDPLLVSYSFVYVGPASPYYNNSGIELKTLANEQLALTENGMLEYRNTGIDRLIPRHAVFSNAYLLRKAIENSSLIALYMSSNQATDWFTENTRIKKLPIIGDAPTPTHHCLLYKKGEPLSEDKLQLKQCILEAARDH